MNPATAAEAAYSLQRPVIESVKHHMKAKVLIVEDDPHILLGLEEVLKSDGFDVAVCNRGDQ
jgi:PleD family two-component response regulator